MIKLVVKLCLVLNPTMCLAPINVIPADQNSISSVTSCLMGGAIYTTRISGAEYYAKIFCGQVPDDLSVYLREKVK